MIHTILAFVAGVIIWVITHTGHVGVAVLMAIDSCNIPIPSEITMPFAGFLTQSGALSWWGMWGVIIAGTVGSVFGSWVSYHLAGWVMRYRMRNRFLHFLFSDRAVGVAERWFARYGVFAVLIGRVVPIVRTFISLPAGIARMRMQTFLWFTAIGSLVWSIIMAYLGYFLGSRWYVVETYFRKVEYGVLILLVVWIGWKMISKKKVLFEE